MAKVIPSVHGRNREQSDAAATSAYAPEYSGTQAYIGDDYNQGDNLYDEAWGPIESQAEALAMSGYMRAQEPNGPPPPPVTTKRIDGRCPHCGK